MTLIDLFREFSSVSTRESYSSSSRILYYTLLWCWNEQRRPEVTTLTTKQLYTLTGLPETTFREAFQYLADRGWIKRVKSRKRGLTAYLMRDRCGSSAPPAGFSMSPAQSKTVEGREETPNSVSSKPNHQSAEVHANVREHNNQGNTRTAEESPATQREVEPQHSDDDRVHGEYSIIVPELET